jgi:hypothetical protein
MKTIAKSSIRRQRDLWPFIYVNISNEQHATLSRNENVLVAVSDVVCAPIRDIDGTFVGAQHGGPILTLQRTPKVAVDTNEVRAASVGITGAASVGITGAASVGITGAASVGITGAASVGITGAASVGITEIGGYRMKRTVSGFDASAFLHI